MPWLHFLIDGLLIAAAGVCAFLLRFEFELPRFYWPSIRIALVVWLCTKLAVFAWYRLHRRAWRFFSIDDVVSLARANAVGSALSVVAIYCLAPTGFPRSIPILDFVLCSLFLAIRFLSGRIIFEAMNRERRLPGKGIVIYGAGRAGVALSGELRMNPALGYEVVGFIDDDPKLANVFIQGTPVLGAGVNLAAVVMDLGVTEVLIAMPSAKPERMLKILQYCQQARVPFRTVAAISEAVEGKAMAAQIREVDVQDLLSRDPVDLDHSLVKMSLGGKVVMVTGAAGSIGSELCRQIARFEPAALVAFDVAETPLFHLEREMRSSFPRVEFHGEIGSIRNERRVRSLMEEHRPAVIYHAAAYKHVPVMESNVLEAVGNNVLGTRNVAMAAAEFGVGEFVLVSSDKAVRPTSVMGVTKRLCELLIRSLPECSTRYVAVRFGNVLGSNGSVIPLFKEQIAMGGPVTVTHPDMRRYFMTIPEAAQLVLQASAMGRGGEIFVLDMGQQIKIVDIARKLILLSGRVPDSGIRIEFTGTRPGEKLYEELNLDDEATIPTGHRKVKIFVGPDVSAEDLVEQMEQLQELCTSRNTAEVIRAIQKLVPEYSPSAMVRQLAEEPRVAVAGD
ncbi:MAG: polysaccharide biosynthesis protein [Bryobacteraceae bacterium]|nr:polysaccharide biosynthesis protein [Bryobacteraceae bacterium]